MKFPFIIKVCWFYNFDEDVLVFKQYWQLNVFSSAKINNVVGRGKEREKVVKNLSNWVGVHFKHQNEDVLLVRETVFCLFSVFMVYLFMLIFTDLVWLAEGGLENGSLNWKSI